MSDLDIEPGLSTENPDIVYANVDPVSGLLANRKCPSFQPLPFIEGSEPEAFAPCSGIAAQMKSWFSIKSGDTSLPATQPEVEDKNR